MSDVDPDQAQETERLRAAQTERAEIEHARARRAPHDDEAAEHERRAEKADYLREKLDERAESEQDVTQSED